MAAASSSSSKTLMFITIFSLTSWISTAFLPGLENLNLGDMGSITGPMQCMQKLLPCHDYLKSPENPPSSCCEPLSEMLKDAPDCLCNVFNNVGFLEPFNVTIDQALKLPAACGAKVDTSVCSKGADSPTSGTTSGGSASTPPAPVPAAPDEASTKKNSANGITQVGGYGLTVLFVSMLVSVSF